MADGIIGQSTVSASNERMNELYVHRYEESDWLQRNSAAGGEEICCAALLLSWLAAPGDAFSVERFGLRHLRTQEVFQMLNLSFLPHPERQ